VVISASKYEPANYLTKGGGRAVERACEEKLQRINTAALKVLQLLYV
jgi:hypothetical protein